MFMSKHGYQTHSENLDCVSQLEIDQAGYLLNRPRRTDARCYLKTSPNTNPSTNGSNNVERTNTKK